MIKSPRRHPRGQRIPAGRRTLNLALGLVAAAGLVIVGPARALGTPAPTLNWKPCVDVRTLKCATLVVPLDHTRPNGPMIGIGVTKVAARQPSRRIGSLLVNPGGPGASGQTFARQLVRGLSPALLDRFDIIGWDPRGVGSSRPVRCLASTADYDRYYAADPVPDSPAERQALIDEAERFARGCLARNGADGLRFVGTSDVVDDMEDIRRALGEEQISYFGFSYGTLLGARYADRYPDRVRAFVLDGMLDPTADTANRAIHQARGFDQALNGFLAVCGDVSCGWIQKGETPAAAFDRLAHEIDVTPLRATNRRTASVRLLGPGEFMTAVIAALYSRDAGWPLLRRGLTSAAKGDGAPLLRLFDAYADRSSSGYGNIADANAAVNCADVPSPRGADGFDQLADRLAGLSPRFGRLAAYSSLVCGFWPVPVTGSLVPVRAVGSLPILVIGTTRDPATPIEWARSVVKQLANATLLTFDSDGHTAYLTGNACIRKYTDEYLLTKKLPPGNTVCSR